MLLFKDVELIKHDGKSEIKKTCRRRLEPSENMVRIKAKSAQCLRRERLKLPLTAQAWVSAITCRRRLEPSENMVRIKAKSAQCLRRERLKLPLTAQAWVSAITQACGYRSKIM